MTFIEPQDENLMAAHGDGGSQSEPRVTPTQTPIEPVAIPGAPQMVPREPGAPGKPIRVPEETSPEIRGSEETTERGEEASGSPSVKNDLGVRKSGLKRKFGVD